MSKATLYNLDYENPTDITDELYQDVGTDAFQLGTVKRAFLGGANLSIVHGDDSNAAVLVENTDYELTEIDADYSNDAGFNVYTAVRILTTAYQSGDLYITYKSIGSYTDVAGLNTLVDEFEDAVANTIPNTPYLVKGALNPTSNDDVGVDWSAYSKAYCLLDVATTTFEFIADPLKPTTLLLVLEQDAVGGRLASFPAAVKWAGGAAALTAAANAIDIVNIYWDGVTYYGTILNNFAALA